VQIQTLATSTQARAEDISRAMRCVKSAYNGDYIGICQDFMAGKTVKRRRPRIPASGDMDDLDAIRQFAVAYLP
jgi:arginyl-tRNA synthetase